MWAAIAHRRTQAVVLVLLSSLVAASAVFGPLYARYLEHGLLRDALAHASVSETGITTEQVLTRSSDVDGFAMSKALPAAVTPYFAEPTELTSGRAVVVSSEKQGDEPITTTVLAAAEPCRGIVQLTAIAVAIACFPGLLLGDEPTSQLDHVARDRVISALQEVNRQTGMTIIVVTHDPAVAAALPRTVTIRDGRVRAEGRQGEEFAVVSADGSCPCRPPRSRPSRPGTLVRVHEDASGWRLLPQGVDPDEAVGAVSMASGMPLTSQALTGSLRTGREER